jgi:uncharacterized Zn finger protein (UPF0148 family)
MRDHQIAQENRMYRQEQIMSRLYGMLSEGHKVILPAESGLTLSENWESEWKKVAYELSVMGYNGNDISKFNPHAYCSACKAPLRKGRTEICSSCEFTANKIRRQGVFSVEKSVRTSEIIAYLEAKGEVIPEPQEEYEEEFYDDSSDDYSVPAASVEPDAAPKPAERLCACCGKPMFFAPGSVCRTCENDIRTVKAGKGKKLNASVREHVEAFIRAKK